MTFPDIRKEILGLPTNGSTTKPASCVTVANLRHLYLIVNLLQKVYHQKPHATRRYHVCNNAGLAFAKLNLNELNITAIF